MFSFKQFLDENRCWKGYKPVKGKKPFSKGSCKKIEEKIDKESMSCNKPRASSDGKSSHVVKACYNAKEKVIRFGQKGVKGSPKRDGESEKSRKRRKSFKARHAKNIAKGKSSAAYWANRVKW